MTSSQRDDSNSPEKPDSLNTDTNVGIEKLRAKLFHLNGLCLPTDHQCTYEPGRNDTQILDETMSLILLDRSQRDKEAELRGALNFKRILTNSPDPRTDSEKYLSQLKGDNDE